MPTSEKTPRIQGQTLHAACILLLTAAFSLSFLASSGQAMPALPKILALKQADGAVVKARQWGDESAHGWETADGYALVFDETHKSWSYAEPGADGGLKSSGKVPGKDQIPAGLRKKLRPSAAYRATQPVKRLSREGRKHPLHGRPSKATGLSLLAPQLITPSTDTANVPVLLVNFSDTVTTYDSAAFSELLFGTGNNSMSDYYREASYGVFSVSAGPSGVAGWFTAGHPYSYYGMGSSERWVGTLVREAVAAADPTFDFSAYDQDGDCYVDVVDIIHQGPGQESSGVDNDIWSHRWDLRSAYHYGESDGGEYTTNDLCPANPAEFVKVNDYVIQPEILDGGMQTIGVFAHEFGHSLGLPDLYDTDYSSEGIGYWCLMAAGGWNRISVPGDRPAHLDAWAKYFLDWVQPQRVEGSITNVTITAAALKPDVYQLLYGTPLTGEYFLVENRQKLGFDAGLPGAGLLIWHIDGGRISSSIGTNQVNNFEYGADSKYLHYGVDLEQADNRWDLERDVNRGDAGDPYPSGGNNSFTDISLPSSRLYDGGLSGANISEISSSASVMTATFNEEPGYLRINGPDSVLEGMKQTYTAVMYLANGSSEAVVATWSINPASAYGSINSAGQLTAAATATDQVVTIQAEGRLNGGQLRTASKDVTVKNFISPNAALDSGFPFLLGYEEWAAETAVTHDGDDALQSGPIADGNSAVLETSVTGAGVGSFYWKVSSEPKFDVLHFSVDGAEMARISGEVEWTQVHFTLIGNGRHTLRWLYSKDAGARSGHDAAWLDEFEFVPGICKNLSVTPLSAAYSQGENTGVITVTADQLCNWNAAVNVPWLNLGGEANGMGNGTVTYQIAAGTGNRSGEISVSGKTVAITQSTRPVSAHDGDLDGNGVSSSDASRALQIAAGLATPTDSELLHGDVAPLQNSVPQPDGKIDISDVAVILRWARGL